MFCLCLIFGEFILWLYGSYNIFMYTKVVPNACRVRVSSLVDNFLSHCLSFTASSL